ncbi:MAG: CvpA family protein [Alphaproteobacteria bacterium]|nr:CvpA family protein [Alphaproteobacteria bacterium]
MQDIADIRIADGIVALFLLVSGVFAYNRGLVREVLSLLAWAGAATASYYGHDLVGPYARELLPSKTAADAISGVALFVVALLILTLTTGRIAKIVSQSQFGPVDRSLGFLYGLARGALVVCIAYQTVSWVVPPAQQPPWVSEARTRPLVERGAAEIMRLVPARFQTTGRAAAEDAERSAREAASEALLRQLAAPSARSAVKGDGMPGERSYNTLDRRQMDRLIQGAQ